MLREELKTRYEEDGFMVVENILTQVDLDRLRERIEKIGDGELTHIPAANFELEPALTGDTTKAASKVDALRKMNDLTLYDDLFLFTAMNPKILDAVEAILGPNIKIFGDQFFVKPPFIGIEKPYHQDHAYFTVEPKNIVTCWMALEDATIENGCLHFIPGSHKLGLIDHSQKWMVGGRQDMQVPTSLIDTSKEVAVPLKAGSASFHHSMVLHRSGPNRSPHRRWGWAISYMSAESAWTGDQTKKPAYKLVRGREFPGRV